MPAIASVLNNVMAGSQLWTEPTLPALQLSSNPCRCSAGALAYRSLLQGMVLLRESADWVVACAFSPSPWEAETSRSQ